MLVEVPDSLVDEIQSQIEDHLLKRKEIERLNTEASLDWFVEKGFHECNKMVTRSSVYKKRPALWLHIGGYTEYNKVKDPPVVMKGSRYALHIKYCYSGSSNNNPWGWCDKVIDRYIRCIRLTSSGRDKQWKSFISDVEKWLEKRGVRYGANRYLAIFKHSPDIRYGHVFLNGKEIHAHYVEAIAPMKSLMRHLEKITKIDEAAEKLLDKIHERAETGIRDSC
jgi:hypothetical protein